MIDLQPTFELLLQALVAPLLLALGALLIQWLRKRAQVAGLEVDDKVRAYLTDALAFGVELALREARRAANGRLTIQVENDAARKAAQYVLDRVPDAVRHFKLSPDALEQMARARFPIDRGGS